MSIVSRENSALWAVLCQPDLGFCSRPALTNEPWRLTLTSPDVLDSTLTARSTRHVEYTAFSCRRNLMQFKASFLHQGLTFKAIFRNVPAEHYPLTRRLWRNVIDKAAANRSIGSRLRDHTRTFDFGVPHRPSTGWTPAG